MVVSPEAMEGNGSLIHYYVITSNLEDLASDLRSRTLGLIVWDVDPKPDYADGFSLLCDFGLRFGRSFSIFMVFLMCFQAIDIKNCQIKAKSTFLEFLDKLYQKLP